jgi:hypothetical protein
VSDGEKCRERILNEFSLLGRKLSLPDFAFWIDKSFYLLNIFLELTGR